jgi:hypothetical protein
MRRRPLEGRQSDGVQLSAGHGRQPHNELGAELALEYLPAR